MFNTLQVVSATIKLAAKEQRLVMTSVHFSVYKISIDNKALYIKLPMAFLLCEECFFHLSFILIISPNLRYMGF